MMTRVDLPRLREKSETVGDQAIHFVAGGSGQPIVLLHGWGGQIASFGPIPGFLAEKFHVVVVDLPGFGESPVPTRPWDTQDYGDCVAGLVARLGIGPVTLIGHSHGGRTAIALTASHPPIVRKLILVDSAGILPRRGPHYYTRVYSIKLARKILLLPWLRRYRDSIMQRVYRSIGSADYNAATDPILRATLVKVVNDDLRPLLPKIGAPTLLIWGTLDEETPIADGRLMERLIPDAGLVEFVGAGHFSYLDQPEQFCRIVTHFVEN